MMTSHLPNFIIAGVTKGGTTSIFRYLAEHPHIFPSSKKEVSYFTSLRYKEQLPALSVYESFFKNYAGEQYRMEASPSYFCGGRKVAASIKERLGDLKIMLSMRNPVDRMFSKYTSLRGQLVLDKNLSFSEYIKRSEEFKKEMLYVRKKHIYGGFASGKYADFIEDWLEVFGKDLRVFFFEDLIKDNRAYLRNVCRWLGLDSSFYGNYNFVIENKSRQANNLFLHSFALKLNKKIDSFLIRHYNLKGVLRDAYYAFNKSNERLRMSQEERSYLIDFFKPYNEKFFEILARNGYEYIPDWSS
jgi:hypothetical protein